MRGSSRCHELMTHDASVGQKAPQQPVRAGVLFDSRSIGVFAEPAACYTMSSVSELTEASSAITNPSHPYDSDLQASTHSLAPSVDASPGRFRRKTSPIWLHCRIEEGKATRGAWIDPDGTRWWHCQHITA